jgi:hypothetical protein
MNRATTVMIGLTGLAVVSLSACANDGAREDAKPAASATVTVTSTTTATASPTSTAPSTSTITTTTTQTSSPMVGGMTECTRDALAQPATQAAEALGAGNLYTVDELSCADGWAVTSGLLASKDNPQMGAPTSFIFEQEGQFWIPKDKSAVCGTNPTTTTPPADAVIPAALFLAGCAAG